MKKNYLLSNYKSNRMKKYYVFCFAILFLMACNNGTQQNSTENDTISQSENQAEDLYVFTYFVKEKDGMYMAISQDGLNWQPLNDNKPVLKSVVGDSLLRDPSMIQDKNGVFHLVYTTSWTNLGFGYTRSTDLVNWETQKFIPVDTGILSEGVRNAWAPEFYYDSENDEYYIIWASAKRKIPTLKTGFKGDQKQYFIKTKDFTTFTQPQLLFGDHLSDASVIDCYIIHPDSLYYFFFKIQADNLTDGGKDGVYWMTAPGLHGPYSEKQPIPNARGNCEGPTVTKAGDSWIVYYDAPKGAARSKDLKNWKDITGQVKFPEGFRHGSVIRVKKAIVENSFTLH